MVTFIGLWRERLITKENMVATCKGEIKTNYGHYKQSICDDLEALLNRIMTGTQDMDHERTYFLPKVSECVLTQLILFSSLPNMNLN